MGLGSTAKKVQMISDKAEEMYKQVQQLQKRIIRLEGEVDDTHDTVENIDHQLTEQRQLLLAMADEQGIDGEQILANAAIDEAEETETEAEEAESDPNSSATTESKPTDGSVTPTEQ